MKNERLFKALLIVFCWATSSISAATWVLARFELDRFQPEIKTYRKETAALLWDEKQEKVLLKLKQGSMEPVLLLSLKPSQLPGFDRELARLKAEDSQTSALAVKLLEEAGGRKLRVIGHLQKSGMLALQFGFQRPGQDLKLELWGTLQGKLEKRGEWQVFEPQEPVFIKTSADLFWDLIKDQALLRIQKSLNAAKRKKGGSP